MSDLVAGLLTVKKDNSLTISTIQKSNGMFDLGLVIALDGAKS